MTASEFARWMNDALFELEQRHGLKEGAALVPELAALMEQVCEDGVQAKHADALQPLDHPRILLSTTDPPREMD